uniref:Uncharacterized protein n=1 Tax=Rhizophora mucronata TaxID=61149 RepID=A0A2P2JNP5_RHIMU
MHFFSFPRCFACPYNCYALCATMSIILYSILLEVQFVEKTFVKTGVMLHTFDPFSNCTLWESHAFRMPFVVFFFIQFHSAGLTGSVTMHNSVSTVALKFNRKKPIML